MKKPVIGLIWVGSMLLVSLSLLSTLLFVMSEIEEEKRDLHLEKELEAAVFHFKSGIETFATEVSGIRSFVSVSDQLPSPQSLQQFLRGQITVLPGIDSLVISFLDTAFIFHYSFTPHSFSPNQLEGTSVTEIRDQKEVKRLRSLMQTDEIQVFPPLNLVEGWAGLPLNFRASKDGRPLGMFAPIVSLKSIIDQVYEGEASSEFVYRFSTSDGLYFDRERVYDGTPVYHKRSDETSAVEFAFENASCRNAEFTTYGMDFRIEIAYKNPFTSQMYFYALWITLGIMAALVIGIFLLTVASYSVINRLRSKNQILRTKSKELTVFNQVLKQISFASSHSLKEPLRNIGSFSSLLVRRYERELGLEGKEYMGYINQAVVQMQNTLNDFNTYAELVAKQDLPISIIHLQEQVHTLKRFFLSIQAYANTQFEIQKLPVIEANPQLIHMLFHNLISNAIKFNEKAIPEIQIGYEEQGTEYVFFVRDNGIGIQDQYYEKIFEAFQHLKKNSYSGTGLGLTLCKYIVEHYQGKIWVESEEGIGSTFYFSIPKSIEKSGGTKTNFPKSIFSVIKPEPETSLRQT